MSTQAVSKAFEALSDATRRKILQLLRKKSMTAGQIATYFPISKPSLSHHFAVLKSANLIQPERDGQQIYYHLNSTVFYQIMSNFLDKFGGES